MQSQSGKLVAVIYPNGNESQSRVFALFLSSVLALFLCQELVLDCAFFEALRGLRQRSVQ
jgi:hypothetical protein